MSASHDRSQKVTFIYSNLYQVYKQGQTVGLTRGEVIKKNTLTQVSPKSEAILGLKNNLKELNDLHSRLQFMLKELENLSRKAK